VNPLDIVLILVAIAYAVAGFKQGFLVGALGVVGLITGGLLGAFLGPVVLQHFDPSTTIALAALGAVVVCALAGQTAGAAIGDRLRERVTWRPASAVDAGAGSLLSVVAVLLVTWILGAAVAGAHLGSFTKIVRDSEILAGINKLMPTGAERGLLAFSRVVDPGLFPRYLEPFAQESIAPVAPPDLEVLGDADIKRSAASVVRVVGLANSCSRSLEGTGFVYAPGRVMTNAHVVAGVRKPQVEDQRGRSYDAEVVLYDADRDIAVLAAPDLELEPLTFDTSGKEGDSGAVLGFPENGPFTGGPARVRSQQRLRGPNIYGDRDVIRDVYALYATVRPGNSGGPLLSDDGEVLGVIFAASVEDTSTGYALTADEVSGDAKSGIEATNPVSTGGCA
jgi:S1-C subfamily serine protease